MELLQKRRGIWFHNLKVFFIKPSNSKKGEEYGFKKCELTGSKP